MVALYFSNIWLWLRGHWEAIRLWRAHPQEYEHSRLKLVKFLLYWFFDVGVNTLTGGDPRESLSSSWYKDTNAWFPSQMVRILNWADYMHGERAHNPYYGENSTDNRELPGRARTLLTVFWLVILFALVKDGAISLGTLLWGLLPL